MNLKIFQCLLSTHITDSIFKNLSILWSSACYTLHSCYKHDFLSCLTDRSVIDKWVKTSDKPSFLMARRLIKEEALLVGGSSGAAVLAACQVTGRFPSYYPALILLF